MKKLYKAITALIILIPVSYMVMWSFTSILPWPQLLPEALDFGAWARLIGSRDYLTTIGTSIAVSLCAAAICILTAIPAAYAITCYDFYWKSTVRLLVYLPFFIPSISLSLGLHSIFLAAGHTDSFCSVVLSHIVPCMPYAVMILENSFEQLGRRFNEQGRNLGASSMQLLRLVYLPNLKPAVLLSTSMCFIVSFSQYLLTFLVGGGIVKTLPVMLFQIMQNGNRMEVSAYSLGFIILGAACTYILQVYLGQKNTMKFMV